ncbi:MAG: hypothetical protein HEP80_18840 [Dolichospermum sp. UKL201]|jgi:hypothetical protein|nr:MAG: hypothetical protein HEP80_18840 [Dolichospermum sp. UKL201]
MLIVGSSEFNGNMEKVHNEERQTQRQVGTMIERHLNQVNPLDRVHPKTTAEWADLGKIECIVYVPLVMVICL